MPIQPCSHSPCLNQAQGENKMEKLMSQDKVGGTLTDYHHGQNRLDVGKMNSFIAK